MEIHKLPCGTCDRAKVGQSQLVDSMANFLETAYISKRLIVTYDDIESKIPYVNISVGDKNAIREELLKCFKNSWVYSLNTLKEFNHRDKDGHPDRLVGLYYQLDHFANANITNIKEYAITSVCKLLVSYIEEVIGSDYKTVLDNFNEGMLKSVIKSNSYVTRNMLWFILEDAIGQIKELFRTNKIVKNKQALILTINNKYVLIKTLSLICEQGE
jgi:hypothetical protein|nr:MAG TPA: hypothetical protein [Caudoviricetes sp.]